MSRTTPARVAALEALTRMRRGDLADRAVAEAGARLDSRDHGWLQELVFGAARLRGRIDHYLSGFVRSGLDSLEPVVLDVLRLGAYQMLEMESVPPYAAVSQSVELVRAGGAPRAAGLVNAVLQSLHRGRSSVEFPPPDRDPLGHFVTWGSHPSWLVERWMSRWSVDEVATLIEHNNERPGLFIRPIGETPAVALERLEQAGVEAELVEGFTDSVRILADHGPAEVLALVPAVVQDPAASMVVRFSDFRAGTSVLDLSAAPGGKTVGVADLGVRVTAHDVSLGRIQRVRQNVERLGFSDRVALVVGDARRPPFSSASGVLLDAPCTGTGTLQRHPDGRWRITDRDLRALVDLQRELLSSAAALLEIGGVLVYSTCSLEPEENDEQVEWLLRQRPDLRLVESHPGIDGTMLDGPYLRLLPQRQGFDGAFAARLERIE